jgi:ribose/xylose/arabinose/galactoside ABC-type transport system permease subunit
VIKTWIGSIIAIGIVLILTDIHLAKKKKEGFTPTDKRRVVGIFWLIVFFCVLVVAFDWLSPD